MISVPMCSDTGTVIKIRVIPVPTAVYSMMGDSVLRGVSPLAEGTTYSMCTHTGTVIKIRVTPTARILNAG
jgi:hypothetical protein